MLLAYIDTRLGQIMINCDSWLKSVWHGVFMPREKRGKFADRWRHINDPLSTRSIPHEFESGGIDIFNLLNGFKTKTRGILSIGLQDISQDPDYAEAKQSFQREVKSDEQIISDDQFLLTYAEDLSMVLTVYLDKLSQWKNCLIFNGNYTIQSQIKTIQDKYK